MHFDPHSSRDAVAAAWAMARVIFFVCLDERANHCYGIVCIACTLVFSSCFESVGSASCACQLAVPVFQACYFVYMCLCLCSHLCFFFQDDAVEPMPTENYTKVWHKTPI